MRFLSICSGIEAASVAFHPLGWQALAFAEIEPFPCSLLAHHYPGVPNLGDLTRWREWSPEMLAQADTLCGGTPCQAFSVAGLRGSLSDERGNLTLTFCHLFDEIDRQRHLCGRPPAVCLWENVPGVLNTDDNAFVHFLAGLAGEDEPLTPPGARWTDAGYVRGPRRAIAWRTLDAQYFQLAQRRERVFVVASADPAFDPAAVLFELDGLRRDTPPRRGAGEGVARGFETGPSGGQFTNVAPTLDTRCKDGPIRNQLGVAERVAGVPEVANCLTRRMHKGLNTTLDEGLNTTLDEGQTPIVEVTHALRAEGFDASEDGTGRGTSIVPIAFPERLSGTQCASEAGLSSVLQSRNPTAVAYPDEETRRQGDGESFAFDLRGREGGAMPEGPHATANLRAGSGGSSRSYVAQKAESEEQRAESSDAFAFHENQRGELTVNDTAGSLKVGGGKPGPGYPAVAFQPGNLARGAGSAPSMDVFPTLKSDHGRGKSDQDPHVACQEPQAYTLHGSREGTQAVASATDTAIQNSSTTVALQIPEVADTLRSGSSSAKAHGKVNGTDRMTLIPSAASQWRVRRLTPEECEMLQGFPVGYTLIPGTSSKKRKGEDLSATIDYLISLGLPRPDAEVLAHSPDGPRYKALGNSWAVPVARWIARRIDACAKALSRQ